LGLPCDLLVRGFHLNIFLTVLVSGILCTWPNQLSLWALIQLTVFLCFINLSSSSLFLILRISQTVILGYQHTWQNIYFHRYKSSKQIKRRPNSDIRPFLNCMKVTRGSNPGREAKFPAPVRTGPGVHPAFCTMGTGSSARVKRPGRGVDHPPPPI